VKDAFVDALAVLKRLEGRRLQLTLAFGDILLARTDVDLEDVQIEDGRLVLTGSFEETEDKILYREVALPMAEDEGLNLSSFAGELRLTTSEGFVLQVIPLQNAEKPPGR